VLGFWLQLPVLRDCGAGRGGYRRRPARDVQGLG